MARRKSSKSVFEFQKNEIASTDPLIEELLGDPVEMAQLEKIHIAALPIDTAETENSEIYTESVASSPMEKAETSQSASESVASSSMEKAETSQSILENVASFSVGSAGVSQSVSKDMSAEEAVEESPVKDKVTPQDKKKEKTTMIKEYIKQDNMPKSEQDKEFAYHIKEAQMPFSFGNFDFAFSQEGQQISLNQTPFYNNVMNIEKTIEMNAANIIKNAKNKLAEEALKKQVDSETLEDVLQSRSENSLNVGPMSSVFSPGINARLKADVAHKLAVQSQQDILRNKIPHMVASANEMARGASDKMKSLNIRERTRIVGKSLSDKVSIKNSVKNSVGGFLGIVKGTYARVAKKTNDLLVNTVKSIKNFDGKTKLALGTLAASVVYVAGQHDFAHSILHHFSSVDLGHVDAIKTVASNIQYSAPSPHELTTALNEVFYTSGHNFSPNNLMDLQSGHFASLQTVAPHTTDKVMKVIHHTGQNLHHIKHAVHHAMSSGMTTDDLNNMSLKAVEHGDTSGHWLHTGSHNTLSDAIIHHDHAISDLHQNHVNHADITTSLQGHDVAHSTLDNNHVVNEHGKAIEHRKGIFGFLRNQIDTVHDSMENAKKWTTKQLDFS